MLSVEVPAETVKKAYDRDRLQVRGDAAARLPQGSRAGDLVLQHVGDDFVRAEALEDAMPEWGDEA